MELRLQGKVAIITGGSKGIGKTVALALAQEGVDVSICARGIEALEEAASQIRSLTGRRVLPIKADMGRLVDIQQMVATTVDELGRVDILMNGALNSVSAPFLEMPDEEWLNRTNLKILGYVRCAREVIPHMKQRSWGRIINIGGMAARDIATSNMSGGVTNAAVSNFTKNLAEYVAGDGILVNCLHPGITRTSRSAAAMQRQAASQNIGVEEAERRLTNSIPIGRLIEPEDVANLVLFLASDKASAITGQTIGIEGGAGRGVYY